MSGFSQVIVTILTSVIGVAIIAVIVSNRSNTAGVLTSGANGFSKILSSALSPIN